MNATPLEAVRFVIAIIGTFYAFFNLKLSLTDNRLLHSKVSKINLRNDALRTVGMLCLLLPAYLACVFTTPWPPAWVVVGQSSYGIVGLIATVTMLAIYRGRRAVGRENVIPKQEA